MQAIIFAAGQSTRFWPLNSDHKSTFELFGKPLLIHTLMSLQDSKVIDEAIIVHSPSSQIPNLVSKYKFKIKIKFLIQKQPKGTGDTFLTSTPYIKENFSLVWPDMVNVGPILRKASDIKNSKDYQGIMVGSRTKTPEMFGMIDYEDSIVKGVIEKPKPERAPSNIKRVGIEIFGIEFIDAFKRAKKDTELDLIYALNEYLKNNKVGLYIGKDIPMLKYPADLFKSLNILINENGHTVDSSAQIETGAEFEGEGFIGKNVKIGKNVQIIGPSDIEEGTIIHDNVVIKKSIIGKNSIIKNNVSNSVLAPNCIIEDSMHSYRNIVLGTGVTIEKNNKIKQGVLVSTKFQTKPDEVIEDDIREI